MTNTIVVAALLSYLVGTTAVWLLLVPRLQGLALDRPNERSLHKQVVPRTGGLAVLLGVTLALAPFGRSETRAFWAVALCLGVVSFIDDRRGLPVLVRLLAQLGAASAVLVLFGHGQPAWWLALAVLTTLWMTNLYNFMDGADGLAGGMGVLGFSSYAAAAWEADDAGMATLCACLAASTLAFLSRNLPPARIFMGDSGSTVLGFCAAAVGLYGHATQLWPLWFPGLVFLPFALDATVTLLRRAARRERLWQAHREHYYQRLIRSGWSHRQMACVAYLLMLGVGSSAVLTLTFVPTAGWLVLAAWLAVIGTCMTMVDARWKRVNAISE
ncbi:MAG: hypothetical protein RLZZ450_1128 [Pseudomonadota bacterium]|jgi:UDP-N-acetylmuramyl pentapeptide phosphotransferase/UDP-N-acetylglucosamine-1-phosphate transferase